MATANRARQMIRPREPTDLDFVVDQEFVRCPDFVIGDVSEDGQRHPMFATQTQLSLLRQARRWYMDAETYNVLHVSDGWDLQDQEGAFTQLWSMCLKQVPILFVLMSRQRAQDYVVLGPNLTVTLIRRNVLRVNLNNIQIRPT
ncbi:hypothetical protein KP79_PYT02183 [Mizuhopecten yessoensis]|uniref:Uncharacterized protein n=1 Tax=Mizuhopecten yessoensis TaxID=6573 RepID=A0A210PYG5_MIZYE|nr:hypothetical protein KP79_PYT02183 [Mizuhopecten yessoensis]